MVVAGVVAMRLAGLSARDAGLIPTPRERRSPSSWCRSGWRSACLTYLLLDPRALGQELAFGGVALVALIVIVNPGIVDEIVFRGVLQRASAGVFGSGFGVLYVSLLYATILPAGLVHGAA